MIDANKLLKYLNEELDIRMITGVPDSLLREFCAAVRNGFLGKHVIAANEGAAVGMAIGHYLASGRPAMVYMQNSGLGNTVNPIASLADPAVYGIPMLLLIGWRSEMLTDGAQLKDEPQHVKQGQITLKQLEILGIPWQIIDADTDVEITFKRSVESAISLKKPVALVVRKFAFAPCSAFDRRNDDLLPTREEAIKTIVSVLPENIPVVATTGMASRELFELRKATGKGHHRDFLTVGGMGHAVSIASGIAISRPDLRVVCFDGDGAMLMHMGALTNTGECSNLLHIVFNNGAHDSVGGQPTQALKLNLADIADRCGYRHCVKIDNISEIKPLFSKLLKDGGSHFVEICCRRGARADLGRPDKSPEQNKTAFMQFLAGKNE